METFILGIILVGALLYFGYKLYPKKDKGCGCGCGGGSSKILANRKITHNRPYRLKNESHIVLACYLLCHCEPIYRRGNL